MKKVTTIDILRVAAGSVVGLSESQAARRAAQLEELAEDDQPKLEKGFTAFAVTGDLQFKIGEKLYVDDVPKLDNPRVAFDDSEAAVDEQMKDEKKAASKKKKAKKR